MKTKETLILEADQSGFAAAGRIIRRGGLVVFPTETVYGLGANALDAGACAGIFAAKGRPQDNPLIVHTADVFALARLAGDVPPRAAALIQAFMPGPLTLILPKKPDIPDTVTAGLPTVGLRVPSDPAAAAFLRHAEVPVAAPSANLSGRPSPTSFAMARAAMEGRVDAIIRAEDSRVGLESTIVRVTESALEILRPGGISEEQLRLAAGGCEIRGSFSENSGGPPPAPGMKYAHYKPKAETLLFRTAAQRRACEVYCAGAGKKLGVILLADSLNAERAAADTKNVITRQMLSAQEYARRLYAEFFVFDRLGCDVILAQYPPVEGIGRAIANRLLKAADGRFAEGL
ncbi:MAG: threonylcarbamoyl-AMP synthase [Spirochaetales bacterium]|jgi:L-threonylcarbamoyladenylate synthase|nr:threonylcarbamoyl-AMP synthase [Spirochaetales bacterium]